MSTTSFTFPPFNGTNTTRLPIDGTVDLSWNVEEPTITLRNWRWDGITFYYADLFTNQTNTGSYTWQPAALYSAPDYHEFSLEILDPNTTILAYSGFFYLVPGASLTTSSTASAAQTSSISSASSSASDAAQPVSPTATISPTANGTSISKLSLGLGLGLGIPLILLMGVLVGVLFTRKRASKRQWIPQGTGRDEQPSRIADIEAEKANRRIEQPHHPVVHEAPSLMPVYSGYEVRH